jgi:hypothetical protein
MPGEFHLAGSSTQLTIGAPTAEQLAALVGLQITLRSNIPRGQQLTTSGGLFYVPERTVRTGLITGSCCWPMVLRWG